MLTGFSQAPNKTDFKNGGQSNRALPYGVFKHFTPHAIFVQKIQAKP
jgi:hypothetical protein